LGLNNDPLSPFPSGLLAGQHQQEEEEEETAMMMADVIGEAAPGRRRGDGDGGGGGVQPMGVNHFVCGCESSRL